MILLLVGLCFKDASGNSVFPLSPIEVLWANLVTSSFLALGLGLEAAQPDVMQRPPHDLAVGVFTRELITDKFVYGTAMGLICLGVFATVAYAPAAAGGVAQLQQRLGAGCNSGYNDSCATVFRARATTYATLTFLLLVTAWECKHLTRSLFRMGPERHRGPWSVFPAVWENRFLFWAAVAGFVLAFPIVYLPVVNTAVFKHAGISWEWGLVAAGLVVYVAVVEGWKAVKRRFLVRASGGDKSAV